MHQEQLRDALTYILSILNVEIESKFMFNDKLYELTQIKDARSFISYVKSNFMNDEYKFLNSTQKFLALVNAYKNTITTISSDADYNIRLRAESISKSLESLMQGAQWGDYTLDDAIVINYFNSMNEEDRNVLNALGDINTIYSLSIRHKLENELIELLKAQEKQKLSNTQLSIANNSNNTVLKRLKHA